MTIISCPNCHAEYEVDNDIIGKKVECAACHTKFLANDSPSVLVLQSRASASKFCLNRKWIVALTVIGVILLIQALTLIAIFSRSGAAENTPVQTAGSNPAQMETPSELLLKYTELGETAYVEALLKQNPTLDVDRPRGKNGGTCLYGACARGYVDIARLLLRRKANPNDNGHQNGWSPITAAAANGYLDVVKLLLSSGVDIESRDRNNKTALIAAAVGDRPDVIRFLCESNAKVNIRGENGWTPLTAVVRYGSIDAVKALVKYGKGIDLEMKNGSNNTALFVAVLDNKPDVVRFLCESGANVNVYGYINNAWTPLTYAADHGLTEVVKILVQYGKDIDLDMKAHDYSMSTPLKLASEKHYDEIVKILMENMEKGKKQERHKQDVAEASDEKEKKKDDKKPTKEFSGRVVSVDDDCAIMVRDFTKSGMFFGIQRKVRLDGIKMKGSAKQFLVDRLVVFSEEVRVTYKDTDGAYVKGTVWENGGDGIRVRKWDGTISIKSLNDVLVDEGYATRD